MVQEVTPMYWTIEEFQAWLEAHLSTRVDSKRWITMAKRLLGTLTIEPDDLLREATFRILAGQRQLNRSVPIEVNLFGVMRSIASSWHKRRKRKPEISLEDLVSSDDEGGGGDFLEVLLIPDDSRAPSPEEELAYKQEMDALQAVFADRPDAQLVLMGRAEGLKGADLAEFAELNASQLATVQRLIARRLAGYRRDE
jgi:DNA-directed RNA polymerase specialized sigma24 family protein